MSEAVGGLSAVDSCLLHNLSEMSCEASKAERRFGSGGEYQIMVLIFLIQLLMARRQTAFHHCEPEPLRSRGFRTRECLEVIGPCLKKVRVRLQKVSYSRNA